MSDTHDPSRFAAQLIRQDEPLSDSQYKEYRMKLENALSIAERREKLVGRGVAASLAVGVVLMFMAGSKVIGSADPGDADATILSVAIGVAYFLALVAGLFGLASYYSRFRPKVREIKEQIRDTQFLALQNEIAELRKQIGTKSSGNDLPR
jgi:hypothetical protein